MTRLRSLIKEVLSQSKKKDCGCGCNDCGGKAPILTESKVKHLISEGLQYHMDKKISLFESVYRMGSEKHFELIREARSLWVRGIIDVSEDDQAILETHLGNFGLYETVNFEGEEYDIVSKDGDWVYLRSIHDTQVGRKEIKVKEKDITINEAEVPLDMPMVNEEKGYGADTAWKDEEGNKVTLEDILNMTKNIPQKDYPTEKLAKVVLNWDNNPKEVERIDQVEVSKQYPILIMVGEDEKIKWILDGNHRAQKALRSKSETIPAKLIKPSNLSSEAKKILLGVVDESLNEAKKKKKKEKKDPPLNKPKRGGSKAYYVYVRDPKTKKIKKVSFGSGGLRAKIKNKKARNAFAARHNCKNKKDRTKAGYWSCNLPRYADQLGLGSKMNTFW